MVERTHGIRISASNLYKQITTQNGFVVQVPLNLDFNRWTVVVFDIYELLKVSNLLPSSYIISESYQIKQITMCACSSVRGIFTSQNLYDFITLPSDMRFKFSFDVSKWNDYFDWHELPHSGLEPKLKPTEPTKDQKAKLDQEIKELLKPPKQVKFEDERPFGNTARDIMTVDQQLGINDNVLSQRIESQNFQQDQQVSQNMRRSAKLQTDPIMELKHIIGYSPNKCLNLKWTRIATENVLVYASAGSLIAYDIENDKQSKFFLGHHSAIVCFDVCQNGQLLASAQEGKNSIVRIWDYQTARCVSMLTMPVASMKCVSFSPDGRYLACVGKDNHNKELVVVWDISKIHKGEKPEIAAKQTSDFNILNLRFSPIDNFRLVSCGKENIRFWRIKQAGNIRGSAVVLNQYARNTVFTALDFEWGARASSSMNPDAKENEMLKRVYVASKNGMVFQINYHTESLEATYRTNDSAIYSIAVNEAFCVTGSDDQFLRVWPLDFSEFFMEAKHEGTVCSVDISLDGLRVVCGTFNGSIGVLDKSNQRYKTVVRSHTNSIVGLDFCVPKRNIITVSYDGTIRLWDTEVFQQVVEFSSPIDQPLCVSAHPYLPIFSCGFASGTMRVFDIEKTCVADEFTQFNKPVKKLGYSPNGALLVTCCEDGSVALHNVTQQHLPTKIMHLQFSPLNVHVSFTPILSSARDQAFEDCLFSVVGEHGNCIMIYDCKTVTLRHQIQTNGIVQSFEFSKNGRELIVALTESKLKFYSLTKFEGIFIREINNVHRSSIYGISLSLNGGYILTGGDDTLVKAWDYEVQKNVPFYQQSFIGHTSPVSSIVFNSTDNGMAFSIGDADGILVWTFNGDVQTNYHPAIEESDVKVKAPEAEHLSVLERMRQQVKGQKPKKLDRGSFMLPQFQAAEIVDKMPASQQQISQLEQVYQLRVTQKQLTYNHFVSLKDVAAFDVDQNNDQAMTARIVNGYDGFSGVHSNLIWNLQKGFIYYTLHNKVIRERTKTREQVVCADSTVRLSCLAANEQYLAAAEGEKNDQGNSYIFVYDVEEMKMVSKLTFHQKGVQSIAFANSQNLISIGVADENALALWDIKQGLVLKSVLLPGHSTNQITVDVNEKEIIQFATIGTQGSFTYWRVHPETGDLQFSQIDLPQDLINSDFVSSSFTMHMPQPYGASLLLIGTRDGCIAAYNPLKFEFLTSKSKLMEGQIGQISVKNQSVVLASSYGELIRYQVIAGMIFPSQEVQRLSVQQAITSLQMDELNNEGILGTSEGNLYYINFNEKSLIKIVQKATSTLERVNHIEFDFQNKNLIYTGLANGDVKILTSQTLDQVMKFQESNFGQVVFVLSGQGSKYRLIGFEQGIIKVVSSESLKVLSAVKIPLTDDELLTSGTFGTTNFAVGTSYGVIHVGSLKNEGKQFFIRVAALDRITDSNNLAVTSVQLSNFDPVGNVLVAFDDGTVRVWQSSMSSEQFEKLMESQKFRKGNKKTKYDLSELGQVQLDSIDEFNMFKNPHGLETLTEEDSLQLRELYGGKKYSQCGAVFAPNSSGFETYVSFVSALQYLFVRNYVSKQSVRRIALMHFPTCIQLSDYSKFASDAGLKHSQGGLQTLASVGTREGRAILYKVDAQDAKLLTKTKSGVIFGQISSITLTGSQLLVASNSGEVASFDLKNLPQ